MAKPLSFWEVSSSDPSNIISLVFFSDLFCCLLYGSANLSNNYYTFRLFILLEQGQEYLPTPLEREYGAF
jgi:hypothetical protein